MYRRSKLQGTYVLLRYIGRVANFYGQNAYEAGVVIILNLMNIRMSIFPLFWRDAQIVIQILFFSFVFFQIDEWLDYTPVFSSGSEFENACTYVDKYLERRTFVVGHSLSIVDIAIWSALAGKGFKTCVFILNTQRVAPLRPKIKNICKIFSLADNAYGFSFL